MSLRDRLSTLLDMRRKLLQGLQVNARDPRKDSNGVSSHAVEGTLRFIGVAEYALFGDVESFRNNLTQVAIIQKTLFGRRDKGEPIDESLLSVLAYQEVFDGLAAGNYDVAHQLAACIPRFKQSGKAAVHPFDYAMGCTLTAFMLPDTSQMDESLSRFSKVCEAPKQADFRGYVETFRAILGKDSRAAEGGLQVILSGHERLSKRRRLFADREDEVLCVWGVGMANLASWHGLAVGGAPPLIPSNLIVPPHFHLTENGH